MMRISARGFYLSDEVFWWRGSWPLTTQKDSGWLWAWSLANLESPAIGGTRAFHQQALDELLLQVRYHVVLWGLRILDLYVCIFPLSLEIFSRCYFSKYFPSLLLLVLQGHVYQELNVPEALFFFFFSPSLFSLLASTGQFQFFILWWGILRGNL